MYIINFVEIAYHQNEILYIIKSREIYTLVRDDIQPKGLMISTTLRAVMIYQVCDLDKKILQNVSHSAVFFGGDVGI